MSLFQKVKGPV